MMQRLTSPWLTRICTACLVLVSILAADLRLMATMAAAEVAAASTEHADGHGHGTPSRGDDMPMTGMHCHACLLMAAPGLQMAEISVSRAKGFILQRRKRTECLPVPPPASWQVPPVRAPPASARTA